ncbi:hypothetical protein, partial [Streptomyces althioticus]|uniref:hypothetical protein n=1 Tax=Streptomyces althioticus TaxID=83380 RepID=UPI0033D4AD0E
LVGDGVTVLLTTQYMEEAETSGTVRRRFRRASARCAAAAVHDIRHAGPTTADTAGRPPPAATMAA